MPLENKILVTTALLALMMLIMGIALGFFWGLYHYKLKEGRIDASICNQYTVIDSQHVITACGDTIQYDWKKLFKR